MNKKILIITLFSMFLLLSITWLTPVQVKAYEESSEEKILNQINELVKDVKNDANIAQLIDIHSNKEIENIFKQLLDSESNVDIELLAQQYLDKIGKDELNSLFYNINQKFGDQIEKIKTGINNLYSFSNDKESISSNYYIIEQTTKVLKATKTEDTSNEEEKLLIRGTDGAIKITDQDDFLTEDIFEKLDDFFDALFYLGLGVYSVGGTIRYIGLFLYIVGFENLGEALEKFGYGVLIFGACIMGIGQFGLLFIDWLSDKIQNIPKNKSKTLTILERFNLIVYRFIERLKQFQLKFSSNLA